jgi:hypothetical protein
MIHKLDIGTCAKNFFLYKISPFDESQFLTHIIGAEDYIGSFVIASKKKGNSNGEVGQCIEKKA